VAFLLDAWQQILFVDAVSLTPNITQGRKKERRKKERRKKEKI